jgi:hypothetical protein
MKAKAPLVDRATDPRLVVISAWIAMMFLYLYCDFFSLYRPGQLGDIAGGKMGYFDVSQTGLLSASILMIIPIIMIFVTSIATARICHVVNMAISPVYLLVNVGNLFGETWAYYFLFGFLESGSALLVFMLSFRGSRRGREAPATQSAISGEKGRDL